MAEAKRYYRGSGAPTVKAPVTSVKPVDPYNEFLSTLPKRSEIKSTPAVVGKPAVKSAVANVVKSKGSPSIKQSKSNKPLALPELPPLLTREGASAVAGIYNGDGLSQPPAVANPTSGVGYYTALGGYNPEAMDNIYNGTYDAMQYNPDGMSYGNKYDPVGIPVIAQEAVAQQGAIPPNTTTPPMPPAPDNSFMSSIGNWWNSMSTPAGLTKEQFANLTEKERVAALGQKSGWENLGATMSGVGSMAGGLAGVYGAYANAKYQKDQANMQKAMIASDEANKSAFAKAAGGTYVGSGVR